MNTSTVAERPRIVDLIEAAYTAAHEKEASHAARWVEANGWRFRDEDFEEVLACMSRLTANDVVELREFRGRMIEERCAA